jgi:spore maturation protein CgeB
MYSSKKELNEKIRFILRNPKRAEIVRKNGFKQVKKHSYINRVKEFIKKINVYK